MNLQILRQMFQDGNREKALAQLRRLLAEDACSPTDIALAGKIASPYLADKPDVRRVMLLGQCTTTWLRDALVAQAWKQEIALDVTESEYDTVLQSLLALPEDDGDRKTDVFVFLPWNQRIRFQLARNEGALSEIVQRETGFWSQVWSRAERHGGRIVQIGYDYTGPGPMGLHAGSRFDGDIRLVRRMNDALRNALPRGAYFIDLEAISGNIGRQTFYDARRYYWTKQPFSDAGAVELAKHLADGIRILKNGTKKVLVLDLDNTLWGGVVGDLGPLGVELGEGIEGEAFRDFQRFCKELSQRGVLLAVASKNNDADAREPFEKNPDMILKLDDIVSFHAHWMPKSGSMKSIAKELNLGIDSLVFFDDNPAEREEVRQNAPEVAVVDVPGEPWNYVSSLEHSGYFETLAVTEADAERTRQYKVEGERRSFERSFTNLDDYLRSLEMFARVAPIEETNIQRVVQLLGKTNQFNVTTRRHDEAAVRRLLGFSSSVGRTFELADKFGAHGLIALALLVPPEAVDDSELREAAGRNGLIVDSFLMSCRVINRTAEDALMNHLFEAAAEIGIEKLVGEYLSTAKNAIVADLFSRFGFTPVLNRGNRFLYEILLPAKPLTTFVHLE